MSIKDNGEPDYVKAIMSTRAVKISAAQLKDLARGLGVSENEVLKAALAVKRSTKARSYFNAEITWQRGADPNFPYEAKFNGERLVIRLNDFPDEKLYTLIANDEEVDSFDYWPDQWARPLD